MSKKDKVVFCIGAGIAVLGVLIRIFYRIFGADDSFSIDFFNILFCLLGAFICGYSFGEYRSRK